MIKGADKTIGHDKIYSLINIYNYHARDVRSFSKVWLKDLHPEDAYWWNQFKKIALFVKENKIDPNSFMIFAVKKAQIYYKDRKVIFPSMLINENMVNEYLKKNSLFIKEKIKRYKKQDINFKERREYEKIIRARIKNNWKKKSDIKNILESDTYKEWMKNMLSNCCEDDKC